MMNNNAIIVLFSKRNTRDQKHSSLAFDCVKFPMVFGTAFEQEKCVTWTKTLVIVFYSVPVFSNATKMYTCKLVCVWSS